MELATKYAETKDPEIAHRFVIANLRLVIAMARRLSQDTDTRLDLIQEGNLSLYEAIERFDRLRGQRFTTYAEWWMQKRMLGLLSTQQPDSDDPQDAETVFAEIKNAASPTADQPAAIAERKQHQELISAKIEKFERTLDSRAWVIFRRHILLHEASPTELSALFKVSRERIEQIKGRILARLKKFLTKELDEATLTC